MFAGAADLSATVIFGSQNIFSGGEAEDASVFGSFAVQTVFSGGTAVRSQLIADTRQDVRSGGTSLMTTALHGSEERVAGIAISTVVDSGGMLNVSGGTAIGAHVLTGSAIVQALGVALGIGVGGTLKLSAGGTAIDADFDEGLEQIFSGGTDIRGSIFEASQTIFAGGESDDAVLAIAAQTVSSGGFALRTVLKTIGEEFVLAGGTSLQTSVLDRSLETVAGRAVGTLVESGGRINVSGGVASATILSSGGTATIGKGGTAIGSLVAGGSQIVGSGGIASATRVGNAGFDHGEETVSAGGRAIGTVVTVGDQTVLAGGIASGTTAGNAPLIIGKQIVARGGLAVGTIVKFQQEVASGGTTSATTIDADGVTIVSSGGVIKGLTDLSGILVLESGAKISTEVEFGDGGDLIISGQTVSAGLLLDAFDETDYIDLASVPFVPGGTASIISGSTLDILEAGKHYDLNFDDFLGPVSGHFLLGRSQFDSGTEITVAKGALIGSGSSATVSAGESSSDVTAASRAF